MFYVGQQVVCINAIPETPLEEGETWDLIKGKIYTVRMIIPPEYDDGYYCNYYDEFTILVEEIPDRPDYMSSDEEGEDIIITGESGYDHRRFKPLAKSITETGMKILREILNKNPILEKEFEYEQK